MKLVHTSLWMTDHPGSRYEYRYACGAAFLGAAEGHLRTAHTSLFAAVTCESCKRKAEGRE